ncbi:MAG TPA: thioesterase family protein [Thermoanaerobaculia bacterium]|nr:thioesterase family protein [Thermoanaerobaculia bacterium]
MHHAPEHAVHATIEVRYAETDQMGIVHHANYLVWFEQARTRLCLEAGVHYAEIERRGYLLLVTGAHLAYRGPSRYGESVDVACWVEMVASRGVTFAYRVSLDGDLRATGSTEHIWVDARTRRPIRFPVDLVEPFTRFLPAAPVD